MADEKKSDWVSRGKTIKQLVKELQSFENQELQVEISTDDGATQKPISLVVKFGNTCVLINCE
jgi:hypothetical protein